jgi:transmembrane sensor
VKVTLVEGKVRIVHSPESLRVATASRWPSSAVTLEAGSALIAPEDRPDHIERLDTERATSWRNGRLVFDGERLADVVTEMNRYSRDKLEIADLAIEGRKVSGVFEQTSGLGLAKALEAYGIVRVSKQSGETIVLDAPQ